jgi:hypothetical protein
MALHEDASNTSRNNEDRRWPQSVLAKHIDDLISGRIDVPEFYQRFYIFYVDIVPGESLSDRESEYFGLVQENLDWTSANPDPESRSYGWVTHAEYVDWLRRLRDRFLAGESLDFT